MAKRHEGPKCQWLSLKEAFTAFVQQDVAYQSAAHIKPLHWYVASRLVIEGGFRPDETRPRPPFDVKREGKRWLLQHSDVSGGGQERTVLGGLKTKSIDVVVTKDGIGPVIAVSMKGSLAAFRNLTNRMEVAVGDCTNLHIAYPALVYGFLHVLRANHEIDGIPPNDVAIREGGKVSDSILRYRDVMARLAGRSDIRDVATKYEAVTILLVDPREQTIGTLVGDFPPSADLLDIDQFFQRLYQQYDQRFIYAAPLLATTTRRLEWDRESPVFSDPKMTGYSPRIKCPRQIQCPRLLARPRQR